MPAPGRNDDRSQSEGFSAAARGWGSPPKLVSRRVGELEQALGVELLHRTTRHVRLTSEGESYYQAAVKIGAQLDLAREEVAQEGPLAGRLRVKVFTVMAPVFMAWLRGVLDAHPALEVDVEVSDEPDELVSRGVDVAFTAHSPISSSVLARRMGMLRPFLAAHDHYVARHGLPQTPDDLARHRCLRFGSQSSWPMEHPVEGQRDLPVDRHLSCNDSRTLQDALDEGLGVGLVLRMRPGLVPVLPGWTWSPMPMYVLIASGRRRLRRVRLVLDSVEEIFEGLMEGPAPDA